MTARVYGLSGPPSAALPHTHGCTEPGWLGLTCAERGYCLCSCGARMSTLKEGWLAASVAPAITETPGSKAGDSDSKATVAPRSTRSIPYSDEGRPSPHRFGTTQ